MSHLINQFVTLFVVIDPIGLAPMFAALTAGATQEYKRAMAIKGVVIAALILLLFALLGDALLHLLGIELAAFRVAGGILLLLLAIDMLFARHSGLRSTTQRETREAEQRDDISVFPLAIPLIAGPGAFTTLLLALRSVHERLLESLAALGVLAAVLAITLAALLMSARIMRFIGETGANVVSRVLGVLLSALAVQFIMDGLQSGFLRH
ncbi:MAG: MarC family protein [Acidiferrobacteraceae bacterium]